MTNNDTTSNAVTDLLAEIKRLEKELQDERADRTAALESDAKARGHVWSDAAVMLMKENTSWRKEMTRVRQNVDRVRQDMAVLAEAFASLEKYIRAAHKQEFDEADDVSPIEDLIRHAYIELAKRHQEIRRLKSPYVQKEPT